MAIKKVKHKLFRGVKIPLVEREILKREISNWGTLHLFLSANRGLACESEIIKEALLVEMTTKKRVPIIKRLHQRYTKIKASEEFKSLMKAID